MKKIHQSGLVPAAAALLLLAGCAGQQTVVMGPPEVRVSWFNSTVIRPELVKFEAKVVIQNNSSAPLELERVDYAVDLLDTELFTDSFAQLQRTKGRGRLTVTFPFQIVMKDILEQNIGILAEGGMRVSFRGTVYPAASSGWEPLGFQETIHIPLPKIPTVSFGWVDGVPLSEMFRIHLRVRNPNLFSLTVSSIESYLQINQQRYALLHTTQSVELPAGGEGTVTLQMEQTPGKTLSMALSTLQSPNPRFSVGGTIECRSPYGWIIIPVHIEEQQL
jgi:LEA14-like dessication related protein